MRPIVLFLALGFYLHATAQNSGMLVGGIGVMPGKNLMPGAKLAYFRETTPRHSIGLKTAVHSDFYLVDKFEAKLIIRNFDLVARWLLTRHDKIQMSFDAGVSMQQQVFVTVGSQIGGCLVGVTEEEMEKKHYEKVYYPGFATAARLDFRLAKRFLLGFELSGNAYFDRESEDMNLYLNPGITGTYLIPPFRKKVDQRINK